MPLSLILLHKRLGMRKKVNWPRRFHRIGTHIFEKYMYVCMHVLGRVSPISTPARTLSTPAAAASSEGIPTHHRAQAQGQPAGSKSNNNAAAATTASSSSSSLPLRARSSRHQFMMRAKTKTPTTMASAAGAATQPSSSSSSSVAPGAHKIGRGNSGR